MALLLVTALGKLCSYLPQERPGQARPSAAAAAAAAGYDDDVSTAAPRSPVNIRPTITNLSTGAQSTYGDLGSCNTCVALNTVI